MPTATPPKNLPRRTHEASCFVDRDAARGVIVRVRAGRERAVVAGQEGARRLVGVARGAPLPAARAGDGKGSGGEARRRDALDDRTEGRGAAAEHKQPLECSGAGGDAARAQGKRSQEVMTAQRPYNFSA